MKKPYAERLLDSHRPLPGAGRNRTPTLRLRQLVNAGVVKADEAIATLRSIPGGRDTSTFAWLLRRMPAVWLLVAVLLVMGGGATAVKGQDEGSDPTPVTFEQVYQAQLDVYQMAEQLAAEVYEASEAGKQRGALHPWSVRIRAAADLARGLADDGRKAAAILHDGDPGSDVEGGGTDVDGVTPPEGGGAALPTFEPSADTRIIYVANPPLGDDANDGLSPQTPVATSARGYSLLRNGFPDWLLFRAGGVYDELPKWDELSGRSEDEPMVVGVWGAPEGERPRFSPRLVGTYWQPRLGDRTVDHVVFHGLASTGDGDGVGVRWMMNSTDIRFVDCNITGFSDNMVFQGLDPDTEYDIHDITISRCIVLDATGGGNKGQGIYATGVDRLLIEHSIFDDNGPSNIFSHNLYIATGNSNVEVRGNILTRAGSHGLQLRSGGVVDGNLIALNPLAMFATTSESVVSNNLILFGQDIDANEPRGWAMDIGTPDSGTPYALVTDNIVAWNEGGQDKPGIEVHGQVERVDLVNNISAWGPRGIEVAEGVEVGRNEGNRVGPDVIDADPGAVKARVLALIESARQRPRGAPFELDLGALLEGDE